MLMLICAPIAPRAMGAALAAPADANIIGAARAVTAATRRIAETIGAGFSVWAIV